MQDVRNIFDMNDIAVRVEHLDEAAHVRAFEFLRQIHEHTDGRDGVLHAARLVAHLDGKAQPAHADLVNAQLACVALALLVVQMRGGIFPARSRHGEKLPALRKLAKSSLEKQRSSDNFKLHKISALDGGAL